MKHLRKYNESKETPQDIADYIKLVFADYIDDGSEFEYDEDSDFFTTEDGTGYNVCSIDIDLPKLNYKKNGEELWAEDDIDSFIENSKLVTEKFEEIKSNINKVKDSYPNIEKFLTKYPETGFKDIIFSYVHVYFKWL